MQRTVEAERLVKPSIFDDALRLEHVSQCSEGGLLCVIEKPKRSLYLDLKKKDVVYFLHLGSSFIA